MAMAQDDPLVGDAVRTFYAALLKAGYQPEAHFFKSGGHGFGMRDTNDTSRHFSEEFYWWLETQGLTRKPGDPDKKAVPGGAFPGAPAGAPRQ
jgi:hypothetical protein